MEVTRQQHTPRATCEVVLNTAAPEPSCTSFKPPNPVDFNTAFGFEYFLSPAPSARLQKRYHKKNMP